MRRSGRPTAAISAGLTLIEVLVALAVLALLAGMSWKGLDAMLRVQSGTAEIGASQAVLQTALAQWETDLTASFQTASTPAMDWDGQTLRLTRSSAPLPDAGAMVVAWSRQDSGAGPHWLRWHSAPLRSQADWQQAWQQAQSWGRNPSAQLASQQAVLMPAQGFALHVYRGGAWVNPLSGDSTELATRMPDGVRLLLTLPQGLLTKDWVHPLYKVNKQ